LTPIKKGQRCCYKFDECCKGALCIAYNADMNTCMRLESEINTAVALGIISTALPKATEASNAISDKLERIGNILSNIADYI
jgi:hypothetical protein